MKTLRYYLATPLLILMLTITAFAGEMTTGVTTPQSALTSVPAEGEMSTTFYGTMHTGNGDEATAGDAVVAGALSLLQGVWSLL